MTLYLAYSENDEVASFEVVEAVSEQDARKITDNTDAIKLVNGLRFCVKVSTQYGDYTPSDVHVIIG